MRYFSFTSFKYLLEKSSGVYVDQYMMSYVISDCEIELIYFLHTHEVALATDLVSVQAL